MNRSVDFSVEWLYICLLGQADEIGNGVNFKASP